MDELNIEMERKGSSSPGNASEYEYVYQFLGGRFITVGGNYWGGKHGAYVEGIRPLRFLCYRLGLTQPWRLAHENRVPTLQELKVELAGKMSVRQVE